MNQHYVPKVYLRNFSTKRKGNHYIDVLKKKDLSGFETNIKNVCGEQELYTLPQNSKAGKDPLTVENVYSRFLEPSFQKAYSILTNDEITSIDEIQRFHIIAGVLQFYFRNPHIVKKNIATHISPISSLYNQAIENNEDYFEYKGEKYHTSKSLETILEDFESHAKLQFKEVHLATFMNLADNHSHTSICVWKSSGDAKYITGDAPILIEENIEENNPDPFLISKQFTLTLNSEYAVILSRDKYQSPLQIKREEVYNMRIMSINDSIFENSEKFVLGKKEDINELMKNKNEALDKVLSPEEMFKMTLQLYYKFPTTADNFEMKKHFKYFIDIYAKNKTFTPHEQQELMEGIKKINRDFHKRKI